jgi:hypothetical protein
MAYTGKRPILPGRTASQTDPVTGEEKEAVYTYAEASNLSGQPLADMPTSGDHVPGEGYYPGDTAMTRRFDGSDPAGPMDPMNDPGKGAETDYGGVTWPDPVPSGDALGDPGHLPRESEYSGQHTYTFQGVPSADPILDAGHEPRMQEDAPTGGGATAPMENKGVSDQPIEDPGRVQPAPGEAYGHERTQEHFGVPSSKAL